jgi:hypothetical protein
MLVVNESNQDNSVILWREHDAVIHLKSTDGVDQSVLTFKNRFATLESFLVWKFHDTLPQSVNFHSLIGILELLNKLEDETFLFHVCIRFYNRSLEKLCDLLIMVNL